MGLLKNVTYALKKPIPYKDLAGNDIQVMPTFPYNPDSKTQPRTAKRWASQGWWGGREVFPAPEFATKNEPFSIRVVGLEKRAEGGRAYKIIDADGKLMDLREDQVLEAINTQGIKPGGEILGPFQWATRGSQMTLMLVGGKEWTRMKEETDAKELTQKIKTITASKLVVGGLYKRIQGNFAGRVFVFMGAVRLDKKKRYVISELYNEQNIERCYGGTLAEIKYGLKRNVTKMSPEEIFQAKMECHALSGRKYTVLYDNGNTYDAEFKSFTYFEAHTSPKFDIHVGTVDEQLLIDLRPEINLRNGFGEILSEVWYKANFGMEDPEPVQRFETWSEFNVVLSDWQRRANLSFNEALEWL